MNLNDDGDVMLATLIRALGKFYLVHGDCPVRLLGYDTVTPVWCLGSIRIFRLNSGLIELILDAHYAHQKSVGEVFDTEQLS